MLPGYQCIQLVPFSPSIMPVNNGYTCLNPRQAPIMSMPSCSWPMASLSLGFTAALGPEFWGSSQIRQKSESPHSFDDVTVWVPNLQSLSATADPWDPAAARDVTHDQPWPCCNKKIVGMTCLLNLLIHQYPSIKLKLSTVINLISHIGMFYGNLNYLI